MNCDCFNQIDNRLREKNLRLRGYTFLFAERGTRLNAVPTVSTDWVDVAKVPRREKKTPPPMLASHCPFCGKAVEKPEGLQVTLPDGEEDDDAGG